MISIELETSDLNNIRFAFSPLLEASMSYRILSTPSKQGGYESWVDEAQRALFGIEFPYLDAVILPNKYIADFMTPTPITTEMNLEHEIERLRATPNEVIQANIRYVIECGGETETRRLFLAYPRESLECLIEELRLYWQRTLSHHWGHITTILENDVLYRAREMALNGVDAMFANLNPALTYHDGIIELDKTRPPHYDTRLHGRGLQLVPGIFESCGIAWQITDEWQPMLIYGARGNGLWQRAEFPEPEAALQITLGAGRARVLQALRTPAHTGELARQLSLTSGAVSQQLAKLHQAGLVESQRSSSKVYYRLSERGEKLLTIFTE